MIFVLTGPESTGKSTLAADLAGQLGGVMVQEVARHYLRSAPVYLPSDLLAISASQQAAEQKAAEQQAGDHPLVIADTDLQVLTIWWQERFGPAPVTLMNQYRRQTPRHYLLCRPDLEWEADPLRENPLDRDRLFSLYQRDLEIRGLDFSIVEGDGKHRTDMALEQVRKLYSS